MRNVKKYKETQIDTPKWFQDFCLPDLSLPDTCLPDTSLPQTYVYQDPSLPRHLSTMDTSLPQTHLYQDFCLPRLFSTMDFCLPQTFVYQTYLYPVVKTDTFLPLNFCSINNKKISQLRYFEYVVCFDLYLYHIISIYLSSNKQYYIHTD